MVAINTNKQQALTHPYLLSILDYNSETGIFTWKKRMSSKAMPGDKAGCVKSTGYMMVRINGHYYYLHRLAWFYHYQEWPTQQIDHIDQNKQNNAISNLRNVDQYTNMSNRPTMQNNNSGVTGVCYCNTTSKWKAYINRNGKRVNLGTFLDRDFAIKARKEAEQGVSQ